MHNNKKLLYLAMNVRRLGNHLLARKTPKIPNTIILSTKKQVYNSYKKPLCFVKVYNIQTMCQRIFFYRKVTNKFEFSSYSSLNNVYNSLDKCYNYEKKKHRTIQ